ncbi:formate--tetrahydrofolate ligase [Bdellovibrionota bacterium FG-1]
MTDIEISQQVKLQRIQTVAKKLGIPEDHLDNFGHYKAKISLEFLEEIKSRPDGKLILVTAISPTPPGEGKTTTTVGLGDALNRIGKKALICLREPSLGPVFGMKGGATGGGYSQVVPMEDINLHFTGDFGAIQLANNLLAALIDNHIHHGNELNFDVRRITWRRVLDMNDRALRHITNSLGGPANGFPREDGFDIVVASEVMAIFCLATSLTDLKARLGKIVVGYNRDLKPIHASDLKAEGAMTVLLKEAFKPNLVQTLEHNPAIIHGGPFANIAHGCNSVIATASALKLADYVVTEAGFGADLGAEKFMNIKFRKSGIKPAAAVLVATVRALKYHGGADAKSLIQEDLKSLESGIANLEMHVNNIQKHYGLSCVVALNHFVSDTPAELELLQKHAKRLNVPLVLCKHWANGSAGAEDLARTVVQIIEDKPSSPRLLYPDSMPLWDKVNTVAKQVYGSSGVSADSKVRAQIARLQEGGYGHLPVCIAKTQYSFSTNAAERGITTGHVLDIREVRLSAGAGFVVMVCGEIMTMPGLPKVPAAERIDLDEHGKVTGLF